MVITNVNGTFTDCFFNEVPLDITAMVLENAPEKGPLMCEIEIELEFLKDSRASGVAELFISRHVEAPTLRRYVFAFFIGTKHSKNLISHSRARTTVLNQRAI